MIFSSSASVPPTRQLTINGQTVGLSADATIAAPGVAPQLTLTSDSRIVTPDSKGRWQGTATQNGSTWLVGYKRADDLNSTNALLRVIKSTDFGVTWTTEALPTGISAPSIPLTGTQAVMIEAIDLFTIDSTSYAVLVWTNGREGGLPTDGQYTQVVSQLYSINLSTLAFTLVSNIDYRTNASTESVQVTSKPVKLGSTWFMAANYFHVATPGGAASAYKVACLRSSDNGVTWTRTNVYTAGTAYNECQCVVENDILELWTRAGSYPSGGSPGSFARFHSLDGITWGPERVMEVPADFGSNYPRPLVLPNGGRAFVSRYIETPQDHALWFKPADMTPMVPFKLTGPSGNTTDSGYGGDVWLHDNTIYALHFTGSPLPGVCLAKFAISYPTRFSSAAYFTNAFAGGAATGSAIIGEGGLWSDGATINTQAFLGPRESAPNALWCRVAASTTGNRRVYTGAYNHAIGTILGTFETTVSLPNSLTDKKFFFGAMPFAAPNTTTAGQKYLLADPLLSANWLLAHVSDAGVLTTADTGARIMAGWNHLRLNFTPIASYASVNYRPTVSLISPPTTTSSRGFMVNFDVASSAGVKDFYLGPWTFRY